MAGQPSEPTAKNSRSTAFLITGSCLLAITGLVWSLDAFFVYIGMAGAVFAFFLGLYTAPRQQSAPGRAPEDRQQTEGSSEAFDDLMKSFSQQKKTPSPAPTPVNTSASAKKGRIVAVAFMIVFFGFFALIFGVVFFADDTGENGFSDVDTAENFRNNGQYDSAEVYYQRALATTPDNDLALAGYGFVFLYRENFDEAIRYFDRALEQDPENVLARYGKGSVYFNQKNYSESAREARNILSIDDTYENGILLAGDSYSFQNQYDSALYFYKTAYAKGIRSAGLSHAIAWVYDSKGEAKTAIPFYKEALSYDSTRVEVYKRLGELLSGTESEWFRRKATQLKQEGY
jgi:tetratricopeptide (TPR) repeat protein